VGTRAGQIWINLGAVGFAPFVRGGEAVMKKVGAFFEFTATDLVGHLDCHRLKALDRAVAEWALPKPNVWDPLLQILSERGAAHEQSYVEHLTNTGLDPVRIDGIDVMTTAVAETRWPCSVALR
jgi:uncharacterized protein